MKQKKNFNIYLWVKLKTIKKIKRNYEILRQNIQNREGFNVISSFVSSLSFLEYPTTPKQERIKLYKNEIYLSWFMKLIIKKTIETRGGEGGGRIIEERGRKYVHWS